MQKWLLGALAAAFVLGVSGTGVMAAPGGVGKPTTPPGDAPPNRSEADKAQLFVVSGGRANKPNRRAILMTAKHSPVFAASPIFK